ncbi:hypothetical protein OHD62_35185 [Mesorhizobium sp. YC-39]|uniref:hypothetical protein n=1 Tax=unclassified Mesorhizobium TaxID=325217 RepID=UPI0021E7AE93|nr:MULTISPECIES: hypothetical protein [unclassified Mesorhizobium]MCV3211857.1 hypothetical protein [Mesorhizobium sp. YC-2]MCV3233580.1 hypothetical protein [Mesorhizobium sp. YC-39]
MVKKQQMRWSLHGAHMLMQVQAAEINGELGNRLRAPFRQPELNGLQYSSPKRLFYALPDPREITGLTSFSTPMADDLQKPFRAFERRPAGGEVNRQGAPRKVVAAWRPDIGGRSRVRNNKAEERSENRRV